MLKLALKFAALCFVVVLTGCVAQAPLARQTVSGYPEETYANATVDEMRNVILTACSVAGHLVQESGPNHVVCGKRLSGNDAIIAQIAIGNSYSTTPERKVRFTIVQIGPNVRVVAQEWIETQMAFGQIRRSDLTSNNQRNELQDGLAKLEMFRTGRAGANYLAAQPTVGASSSAPIPSPSAAPAAPIGQGYGNCRWVGVEWKCG